MFPLLSQFVFTLKKIKIKKEKREEIKQKKSMFLVGVKYKGKNKIEKENGVITKNNVDFDEWKGKVWNR